MSRGSFLRMSVVFVVGIAAGVWTFIEPWVIRYPIGARHQWTPSMWSNVWVGAIVTGASVVALVLAVAAGLRGVEAAQAEARAHSDRPVS